MHQNMANPSLPPWGLYQYQPLASLTGTLRLLKLFPGYSQSLSGDVDPIRCHIFERLSRRHEPYIALSYVWGSEPPTKRITLPGSRYLNIRPSLHDALLRLRHPTEARILWIDSLCINQNDIEERNHQVYQMRNTYSNAERLSVWLGGLDNTPAIALIKQFASRPQNHGPSGDAIDIRHLRHSDWLALANCLGASWFHRMWVIQELVSGRWTDEASSIRVLLGSQTFLWKDLVRCCRWLQTNP